MPFVFIVVNPLFVLFVRSLSCCSSSLCHDVRSFFVLFVRSLSYSFVLCLVRSFFVLLFVRSLSCSFVLCLVFRPLFVSLFIFSLFFCLFVSSLFCCSPLFCLVVRLPCYFFVCFLFVIGIFFGYIVFLLKLLFFLIFFFVYFFVYFFVFYFFYFMQQAKSVRTFRYFNTCYLICSPIKY